MSVSLLLYGTLILFYVATCNGTCLFSRSRRILARTLVGASLASSTVISPLPVTADVGNVEAALAAIVQNPDSLLCNLDNFNIQEGQSSCQQLDNVVRYKGGKLLTIRQDWGGSASTGAAIWNGANMATWFLENRIGAEVKDKNVMELGAGVGFTSIVSNAMGAKNVLITDGNTDVLKLADANIQLNSKSGKIGTARLQWNTDDEKKGQIAETAWDYIFASDVTYKKTSWGDLMACISHLSSPRTKTILSMEPRNVGEIEGVLAEAEKQGLRWREQDLPVDKEKTMCGMMCARLFVLTKT
jgi:16S rRNA G966 N2-methylase RsmD